MKDNIVLIGFMGTGKTAIGIRLAQMLNRTFVDTDTEITKILGMTVAEIFRKLGEVRFRSEEKLLIEKLSQRKSLVISTGGGVALNSDNLYILKQNSMVICLQASPEEILARVSRKKGSRPFLGKDVTIDLIKSMLEERIPYYSQADYIIHTDQKDFPKICQEIIAFFELETGHSKTDIAEQK